MERFFKCESWPVMTRAKYLPWRLVEAGQNLVILAYKPIYSGAEESDNCSQLKRHCTHQGEIWKDWVKQFSPPTDQLPLKLWLGSGGWRGDVPICCWFHINTQAERNILEAVKHPFIVDLLYAFQVMMICMDLVNPNFLRQRENFIWFWSTWAGENCSCTWRGRGYSWRILPAFMLLRSPLHLSTFTDRSFGFECKYAGLPADSLYHFLLEANFFVWICFLPCSMFIPCCCRGSFTATWSQKISSLTQLAMSSSPILAFVKSLLTNKR